MQICPEFGEPCVAYSSHGVKQQPALLTAAADSGGSMVLFYFVLVVMG